MVKIKIVQKGWDGYTGNLGITVFEDGIAECSEFEATRIGANIQVVRLDEDGEEDDIVNIGREITRTKILSAEVVEPLKTSEQIAVETRDTSEENSGDKCEDEELTDPAEKITKEYLEEIADENGIKGLREIGDRYSVKSNSIADLIARILDAQNAV